MNAPLATITPAVETAWKRYLNARDKAEKTRDITDGIAAGKAWAAWLDLFAKQEERP